MFCPLVDNWCNDKSFSEWLKTSLAFLCCNFLFVFGLNLFLISEKMKILSCISWAPVCTPGAVRFNWFDCWDYEDKRGHRSVSCTFTQPSLHMLTLPRPTLADAQLRLAAYMWLDTRLQHRQGRHFTEQLSNTARAPCIAPKHNQLWFWSQCKTQWTVRHLRQWVFFKNRL